MMRPRKPVVPEPVTSPQQTTTPHLPAPTGAQLTESTAEPVQAIHEPSPHRKKWMGILIVFIALVVLAIGAWLTYLALLQPVDSRDSSAQKIVIKSGQSFGEVAQTLQERALIKSPLAFEIMARLAGKHNDVKAGTCTLKRSEPASEILDKITSGCHDFKSVTFYPGATIYKSRSKPTSLDVTDVLLEAGYSQAEIDTALAHPYTTGGINLFANKPAGTDLEGYIYGETYYVDVDATAEEVIQIALNQMASDIEAGEYIAKFKAQGLTLYQGITLASIVQRELSCTTGATGCYTNQQKIAQVFYSRLSNGMTLGSDVTFYYAADKLSLEPTTTIDSPYNTRRYAGLPPGPIAAPGKHALDAVANPASTDYLFFIAGDDGKVYFAHTDAEHNENVTKYCQTLCSTL
ncbi:MAG: endolytic transglycosylase MltG [Candidatus Saccharimonas sp.]